MKLNPWSKLNLNDIKPFKSKISEESSKLSTSGLISNKEENKLSWNPGGSFADGVHAVENNSVKSTEEIRSMNNENVLEVKKSQSVMKSVDQNLRKNELKKSQSPKEDLTREVSPRVQELDEVVNKFRSYESLDELELCFCGKMRPTNTSLNMVSLFEHVNASGVYNFQCCRISLPSSNLNMSIWRQKLVGYQDVIVCDYLEFGFPLDFDKSQKLLYDLPRNHKGAREFPQFINKYLEKECDAGRIAGPFKSNPLSVPLQVSPMNTVPKSSVDERRVIVDLSWPTGFSVNDGISKEVYLGELIELHYASVETVCQMVLDIGVGAVIYKRDLRHAYRQIPVDPGDYKYLGYFWNEFLYFDTVLAMGQRNAAMACSRTTKAVMHIHHDDGYSGTSYLDDLIGVSSALCGDEAYESLGTLLEELGLLENLSKACPPSTTQIVLGVLINTIDQTISVPDEKLHEIKPLVAEWQEKKRCTRVELQSLIGKLQFITKCVQLSRVFLNRLLESLRSMSSEQKYVYLNKSFKKDLRWWFLFMEEFNGVSFIPPPIWEEPDVTFSTDSSMSGCGGICDHEFFHVQFPVSFMQQGLKIHHLEMMAVLLGVRIWGPRCQGMRVQIYCDNESVVQVINSSRTKDPFLGSCLRELWLEVSKYGFLLRAIHLPGEENRIADWLSRWELDVKYQRFFNEFVGDQKEFYTEIRITSEMFNFSGEI